MARDGVTVARNLANARSIAEEKSNIKNTGLKLVFIAPTSYLPESIGDKGIVTAESCIAAYEKLKDLDKFFKEIINDKKSQVAILDLVRNRILANQTDADNNLITKAPTGSVSYIRWYKGKDAGTHEHRYNLYDSGEFFDSLKVVYENKEILIKSTSYKRQAIINAYGENAYQLTTQDVENVNKALDEALQYIMTKIKYKPTFDMLIF